ncbi:lantibiotic dehydratase [Actinomyces ruminis]|uniref:Uncharacterized protein n=1 Tax=Actinomyces ruminis TaxID=1937003 RepID=A0ABX4MB44_9ACTO|nr:lantibiotic dehydratase [Actinomyces ruminis]PHP52546.1 hypothetical protein BW737_008650 [Actinomyces ruminis]
MGHHACTGERELRYTKTSEDVQDGHSRGDAACVRCVHGENSGTTSPPKLRRRSSAARSGKAELLEYLESTYRDPIFSAAVAHAAPTLWSAANSAIQRQSTPKQARVRKLAIATTKFLIRSSARPTPFGLLAGVAAGHFKEQPGPPLFIPSETERVAVADMRWLMPFIRDVETDPELLKRARIYKWPYLRDKGKHITTYLPKNSQNQLARVTLTRTPVVDYILSECGEEGASVSAISMGAAKRFGCADTTVVNTIVRLIRAGVLYTSIRPALNGEDPLREIVDKMSVGRKSADAVQDSMSKIDELNASRGAHIDPATIHQVYDVMSRANKSENYLHFIQKTGIKLDLPESVREDVEDAMQAMLCLSQNRLGMRGVRNYHLAFLERYGIDRVVPLLELMDPDRGLGAPDGYSWPRQDLGPDSKYDDVVSERREARLSGHYVQAIRDGSEELRLSADDISELAYSEFDATETQLGAELYFSISSPSWTELERGNYRIVLGANPGSHFARSTSGRFWSVLPEIKRSSASEPIDSPSEYTAVIKYMPRADAAANLLNVSELNEPIIDGGVAHDPNRKYVPMDRIGIRATTRGLFPVDLADGRAIRIRLHDTVYAPAQAPNEVRLLVDMALEFQRIWEPWSWGELRHVPYRPRVSYGRVVLESATWDLHELRSKLTESEDYRSVIEQWRSRWRVPRFVLIASRDMHLTIDLENTGHLQLLKRELRSSDEALVIRELPGGARTPNEAWGWLRDGDDIYASEFVVSFDSCQAKFAPERFTKDTARADATSVRFMPGSEWKSFRVYLPSDEMSAILGAELYDFFSRSLSNPYPLSFFVRYRDEWGPHLRLRFLATNDQFDAVSSALRDLAASGVIHTYIVDEYDPEIERYGGPRQTDRMHRAFAEDSRLVVTALTQRSNDMYSSLEEYVLLSWIEMIVEFGSGFARVCSPLNKDGAAGSAVELCAVWAERLGLDRAKDKEYSRRVGDGRI